MSLSKLKRNSNSLKKLTEAVEKQNKSFQKSEDLRFWSPTIDKDTGLGSAIIRFLPQKNSDELPWVETWSYGFKGPTNKWYIENSLSTIGKPDPVGEMNSRLWNSGVESDKDVARQYKRRLTYISNIYVVEDPAKPENNGKVFMFKYGQKIYDKIQGAIKPKFANIKPSDPFDVFHGGANFILNIKTIKVGNKPMPNYDDSVFDQKGPLTEDESVLETIEKSLYSLEEFKDPAKFKTYDQLQARLYEVLGAYVGSGIAVVEGAKSDGQSATAPVTVTQAPTSVKKEETTPDDDVPFDLEEPVQKKQESKKTPSTGDSEIDDILSELDL